MPFWVSKFQKKTLYKKFDFFYLSFFQSFSIKTVILLVFFYSYCRICLNYSFTSDHLTSDYFMSDFFLLIFFKTVVGRFSATCTITGYFCFKSQWLQNNYFGWQWSQHNDFEPLPLQRNSPTYSQNFRKSAISSLQVH